MTIPLLKSIRGRIVSAVRKSSFLQMIFVHFYRPVIVVQRKGQEVRIAPSKFDEFPFQSGDHLRIEPERALRVLHRHTDGAIEMRVGFGRSIRVPQQYNLYEYNGYRIPSHLIALTGAGPETLEELGAAHLASYRKFLGLSPDMTVLEIGSGIGRDALQFEKELTGGRYYGIDVQRDSIVWCQRNITARKPRFTFHHFDVQQELHNPWGTRSTMDFRLPASDASVDRVALGSVFTHMFEPEITHYMREIRRILKPNGLVWATFFLYTPEIVAKARSRKETPYGLSFRHPYGDGCYIDNLQYPTGAVAFTDGTMRRMIAASGLQLDRPYLHGGWSGYFEQWDDGQDVAILRV